MRVVALLTVRNEALMLERCLRHLAGQGVDTCVIDHGSDDGTLAIARSHLGRGVFRIEQLPYTGVFRLEEQLRQKERLAAAIEADWFIHLDADEIRQPPTPYPTLREAITAIDAGGWNAVDFDEFVFVPTPEAPTFEGRDYVADMRWYYYFEPESPDRHRINAWKKQPAIDLCTHAGHQVLFPGRRVSPTPFVLRHYLVLGETHARSKYGLRRFAPEERARQWHDDRARFDAACIRWPVRSQLMFLGADEAFDTSNPWRSHFWMPDGMTNQPASKQGSPLDPLDAESRLSPLRTFKDTQGEHVPAVGPAAAGPRPFWSVMIPTYNPRPDYLRETLASVLAQDPGRDLMQIEVVDDGSDDVDVRPVVEEAGQGRVAFFAQTPNAGMVPNWNLCVQRARGEWLHILHQDDSVGPGFYERLRRPCETWPDLIAAWCRGAGMDDSGQVTWTQEPERPDAGLLPDLLSRLSVEQCIIAPAIVVRRRAYEEIGGYHRGLAYCADWDFYKRLAVYGPMWYEPACLARWRHHGASTSTRIKAEGADLADRRRSIELSQAYLPVEYCSRATWSAYRSALIWAADILRDSLQRDDISMALAQSHEIVRTIQQVSGKQSVDGHVSQPAGEVIALRARVDELEAQLEAWMRTAQRLAGRRDGTHARALFHD